MKSKVDKLDIVTYAPVLVDLKKKLSEKEVIKNDVYDELAKNVNAIQNTDTSNLVKEADHNTKIAEIEEKILDHNHGKYIITQEFNK